MAPEVVRVEKSRKKGEKSDGVCLVEVGPLPFLTTGPFPGTSPAYILQEPGSSFSSCPQSTYYGTVFQSAKNYTGGVCRTECHGQISFVHTTADKLPL